MVSGDGRRLVGYGLLHPLRVWDVDSGRRLAEIPGRVFYVATDSRGRFVAVLRGRARTALELWDVATQRRVWRKDDVEWASDHRLRGPPLSMATDGSLVFVQGNLSGVAAYETGAGKRVGLITAPKLKEAVGSEIVHFVVGAGRHVALSVEHTIPWDGSTPAPKSDPAQAAGLFGGGPSGGDTIRPEVVVMTVASASEGKWTARVLARFAPDGKIAPTLRYAGADHLLTWGGKDLSIWRLSRQLGRKRIAVTRVGRVARSKRSSRQVLTLGRKVAVVEGKVLRWFDVSDKATATLKLPMRAARAWLVELRGCGPAVAMRASAAKGQPSDGLVLARGQAGVDGRAKVLLGPVADARPISRVRVSPDGKRVLVVRDGDAWLWAANGKRLRVLHQHRLPSGAQIAGVGAADFSSDGRAVLALDNASSLSALLGSSAKKGRPKPRERLWIYGAAKRPKLLPGHRGALAELVALGELIVSVGVDDKTLQLVDTKKAAIVAQVKLAAAPRHVAARAATIAVAKRDGNVSVFVLETNGQLAARAPLAARGAVRVAVGVARQIYVLSSDGTLARYALSQTKGRTPVSASAHEKVAKAVSLAVTTRQLLTGRRDGVIELRHPESLAVVRRLVGHSGAVTSLATSADGATLYSGGDDGTVVVWRLP